MDKILKGIFGFLGVLVVLFVLAIFFRNAIVKTAVEQAVTRMTGFETKVKAIEINFPAVILVKDLQIKNPTGFEQKTFTTIPEIYIDFNLREFMRKERLHLREIRLNLQEIHIEKNAKGVSNIQLLSKATAPKGGTSQAQVKPAGEKGAALPFLCDKMVLTLRNVSYTDKSKGAVTGALGEVGMNQAASLKNLAIDLNVQEQVFTDIHDPLAIVNIILLKIAYGTTFGKLAGLDPNQLLSGSLKETFTTGEALFKGTANQMGERAGEAAGLATDQAEKATAAFGGILSKSASSETTEKVTGAISQGASGLFGKMKSALPVTTTDAKKETAAAASQT